MRIRKPRGNARGESSRARPGLGSHEHQQVVGAIEAQVTPGEVGMTGAEDSKEGEDEERAGEVRGGIERVDSTSRSSFTWLDKLRHAKGFTSSEHYTNLEDFVSSLARKDGSSSKEGAHIEHAGGGTSLSQSMESTHLSNPALAREGSISSQLSFKQAGVAGPDRTFSPAMVSYNDSLMSARVTWGSGKLDAQLQSDASLPKAGPKWTASEPAKCGAGERAGMPPYESCKVDGREKIVLSLSVKNDEKEAEKRRPPTESTNYLGKAGSSSWMPESFESSGFEKGSAESLGTKCSAGTSSEKPMHDKLINETTEVLGFHASLQPGTFGAVFEQGHASPAECTASITELTQTTLTLAQPNTGQRFPSGSMQRRSSRNRRVSSSTGGEHLPQPADLSVIPPSLAPDHPANQPRWSLPFSVYAVLSQAGMAGLTAREAISNILQQRLPGLEEDGVQSSRKIAKILRSSPYYMELGERKFALCSAMIEAEETVPDLQGGGSSQNTKSSQGQDSEFTVAEHSKSSADSEDKEYKARQTGKRKKDRVVGDYSEQDTEEKPKPVRSGRPKKLKYMKQANAEELGNQCNRSDGKGWTCPLLAKPGYQLCDHHLDKLRCKPGSRSKKKKKKLAAALAGQSQVSHTQLSRAEEQQSVDTAGHELTTSVDRADWEDPSEENPD